MACVVQWEYHWSCMHCQPAHCFSRVLYSRERPSLRGIQGIPSLRVEIHEQVIKNKGSGGGVSQYITAKLLNYLPKGDLDCSKNVWKVSAGSQPLISTGSVVMYNNLQPTKDVDLPGRAKRNRLFFFFTEHFRSGYTQYCKVLPIVSDAYLCVRRTWKVENSFSIKESRIH